MEGGKLENPEKNPWSRYKNQQQNQPTCNTRSGNRPQWWVASALTTSLTPVSNIFWSYLPLSHQAIKKWKFQILSKDFIAQLQYSKKNTDRMFQSPAQNLLEEEGRKISENTFFMKILGQFLLAFWGGGNIQMLVAFLSLSWQSSSLNNTLIFFFLGSRRLNWCSPGFQFF